ncbi:Aspartate aminotransferase [Eubacterium plexicaudatum ASF492]|uniref:Aminotransferase class I/classII large domain-containing protein n=1 Tax=Eubacterium plexicaudatum ASF492 TaxID=1235802 RepID=N2ANC2_9FIRM|nr:Aspartate aminotransferase [Eubacterium plexicaudatum ASF492]
MLNLNERMVNLGTQRSVIRELFEYGKKKAAQIGAENVFDFSIGNPSVPAPASVNQTAIEIIREMDPVILHGYTSAQGDAGVRKMIADAVNGRFRTDYTADNFYISTGAAAALCCCFHGLCNRGDEVIIFAPYFPEYTVFVEGAGAKPVIVAADTQAFQIDFTALEQALSVRTKAVIVNSPNNPSGAVYAAETVQKLAALLEQKSAEYGHTIFLVSDEPYREIVFSGTQVPFLPDYYRNTLVSYSWSKSLSLPGERMGYVLIPSAVDDFAQVYAAIAGAGRSLGYVNAPGLFQRVCAACANETADLSVYETNKNLLYHSLREMGYHVVEPGGTFYMFPRSLEADDAAFAERAKAHNLLIVPGIGFGCPGHVRISYCVPTERIEKSLPAFEALAKEYLQG